MAVYHDARCRMCRRSGMKLFLKGARCFSDKCAIERRGYAPGEHGKSRRIKETNYGLQLREKQKARQVYGLLGTSPCPAARAGSSSATATSRLTGAPWTSPRSWWDPATRSRCARRVAS